MPYKGGSNNTYALGDSVDMGDSKSHLGLNASLSSYRPSFVGGSYRSVKREAPFIAPLQKNYDSGYRSAQKTKRPTIKPGQPGIMSPQPVQKKYDESGFNKNVNQNIYNYPGSAGNESKLERKSRHASPAIERMPKISMTRGRSRDPSPLADKRHSTGEYSNSINNLSKLGHRSRDPSPSTCDLRFGSEIKSRNSLKTRSTDQGSINLQYKSSSSLSQNIHGSNHRLRHRDGKSYGSNYCTNRSSSSSNNAVGDESLSYMSISDFRAKYVIKPYDGINKFENLSIDETAVDKKSMEEASNSQSNSQIDKKEVDVELERSTESDVLIFVKVVTRATSPTPPGTSPIARVRRLDLAKTVEKTIQRSNKKPMCKDKEIQSDRLDDTTKYSRFSSVSRLGNSSWSNPLFNDPKSSQNDIIKQTRNSNNSNCCSSGLTQNENETIENIKKNYASISKSNSSSNKASQNLKVSSDINLIKVPKINEASRQCLTEIYRGNSSRSLPPSVPKADNFSKTSNSVPGSFRWPNKDFRKSALNIGPTDRPRKSRTPSTGTDTEDKSEPLKTMESVSQIEMPVCVVTKVEVSSFSPSVNGHGYVGDQHQLLPETSLSCIRTGMASSPTHNQEQLQNNSNTNYNKSVAICGDQDVCFIKENLLRKDCQINFSNRNSVSKTELPVQLGGQNKGAKSVSTAELNSISNFFTVQSKDMCSREIYVLDNSCSDSSGSSKDDEFLSVPNQDVLSSIPTITEAATKVSLKQPDSNLNESSWWQQTDHGIDSEANFILLDHTKVNTSDRNAGNTEDKVSDHTKILNQQNKVDTDSDKDCQTNWPLMNESKQLTETFSFSSYIPTSKNESNEKLWLNVDRSKEVNANTNDSLAKTTQTDDNSCSNPNQLPNQAPEIINESANNSQINESTNQTQQYGSNYLLGNHYQNSKTPVADDNSGNGYDVNSPQGNRVGYEYNIPWWMTETTTEAEKKRVLSNIGRIESGERAGWLSDSNESSADWMQTLTHKQLQCEQHIDPEKMQSSPPIDHMNQVEPDDQAFWLQNEKSVQYNSPFLDSQKENNISVYCSNANSQVDLFSGNTYQKGHTLGPRQSPEGLEDIKKSLKLQNFNHIDNKANFNSQSDIETLYISPHRDIDEFLSDLFRPFSIIPDQLDNESESDKLSINLPCTNNAAQKDKIYNYTLETITQSTVQQKDRPQCEDYVPTNKQYETSRFSEKINSKQLANLNKIENHYLGYEGKNKTRGGFLKLSFVEK